MHQILSVHTTPEEFGNATIIGHFEFGCGKLGQRNQMSSITKRSVFKMFFFCPHYNAKKAFSNSSRLKRAFEKLQFRKRISVDTWPLGLMGEKKASFSNSSSVTWKRPRKKLVKFYQLHRHSIVSKMNIFCVFFCARLD